MSRWPAILGVVGVDFGSKPAISLAVAPRRRWWRRQTGEDEQPVDFCAIQPAGFMLTISDFEACGCTFSPGQSTFYGPLTGFNGVFMLVRGNPNWWRVETGSLDALGYADIFCEADPGTPYQILYAAFLICTGTSLIFEMRAEASFAGPAPATPTDGFFIFNFLVTLGDPYVEPTACTPGVAFGPSISGGTVLVEV